MKLSDTSVWINIFRDTKGIEAKCIQQRIDEREIVLTRLNQLELLQGCRDNKEWLLLRQPEANNPPTLLIFWSVFDLVASFT